MYAQNISGIHGKVYVERHVVAEAANVILLAADSAIIKSTICNNQGQFNFTVKPGKYLLLVTKIGYDQSLTGPYDLKPGDDVLANEITLIQHLPVLKEVSVTAQRTYVEAKPDKVTLNVQNSINADGNSVFEILRTAPGVHADEKGGLSLIGHTNAMVVVDGKTVRLSGTDLVEYLQSLPANAVKQIELISSPSAKYDAAGAGVINIISRKSTSAGANFTLTGTAGYGKFGKGGGGLIFNSRQKKINVFGNYNYDYTKKDHLFNTNRTIEATSNYDVNYYTTNQGYKQSYNLGADYALTSNHTIGILLSGTINNYNYKKNDVLIISNFGKLDSTIYTNSNLNRGLSNTSYGVNYTGKLDTTGKTLTADFVFNDIDRHSAEYFDNYFYNAANIAYRPVLKLQNMSPSDIHIWVGKVDYVNPLSKWARLEMGLKYSSVQSTNNLDFGPLVDGVYTSSSKYSSDFSYKENINAAYLNYIGKISKVNITAGLRAEQTHTRGNGMPSTSDNRIKRDYLDWFPQLHLNYKVNEKNTFDLSFNRGIDRPRNESVNPFIYVADLYDFSVGNPRLMPQYTNRVQFSHTLNKKYITTLYANVTSNFYDFPNYIQFDTTKISRSIVTNFGKYSIYGVKINVPVIFTNWWEADFNLDASYQRIKAYPQFGNLNKGTQAIDFSTTQTFTLPDNFSALLSCNYASPTFYGIYQFKADYNVNAFIAKQILNKQGRISFGVSDIFNTRRDRSMINYADLNMSVYDKVETRVFRLSFTYRFGNVSLKSIAKHKPANEDEQKRAISNPSEVAGN